VKLGTIQMIDVWIPTFDGRWLILPRYTQPAKVILNRKYDPTFARLVLTYVLTRSGPLRRVVEPGYWS